MFVRDWMTIPAPAVDPYTRINEAKQLMLKMDIRTLAIVEDEKLVGVITRRDILKFDPASRLLTDTLFPLNRVENKIIGQIMTSNVVVINEDNPLKNAAAIMIKNKFNALPVVNKAGALSGMLTTPNLFEFIFKNSNSLDFLISVNKRMSKNVIYLPPNATLEDAKVVMTEEFIRSIPVLENGTLIGIVTRTDLLSVNPSLFSPNLNDNSVRSINETTLDYVMTSKPITVYEDTPIPEIAMEMLEYQIHSIPVLNRNEQLVGIITETDLFQLIAENA